MGTLVYKLTIVTYLISSTIVMGQDIGIKKLYEGADEILLIEVIHDSTNVVMHDFRFSSIIRGKVKQIIKSEKMYSKKREILVEHSHLGVENNFPKDKKLVVGKLYFVFLTSKYLTKEQIEADDRNIIVFSLIDYYLGIQSFDRDIADYLKSQ